MKLPDECQNLFDIRQSIDQIDRSIIRSLGERMAYVRAASKFKPDEASIPAPSRVAEMLPERRIWAEENGLDASFIEKIFSQLINWYIAEQVKYWRHSRGKE